MARSNKKIWVWIIIILIVLLVVGIFAQLFILRSIQSRLDKKTPQEVLTEQMAKLLTPARDKFLRMFPADYDREKATQIFDNFIEASQKGKVRTNMVLTEFAPYLQIAVQDGKLTHEEADSVLKLMKRTIIE